MDYELDEIKRRRLAQLKEQQGSVDPLYKQEQERKEIEIKKQELLRQILTPEARERLITLKMSRQNLVEQIELQLISMAQSGHLTSMIDDDQLKKLLIRIQPKKRDMKIKRI